MFYNSSSNQTDHRVCLEVH